MQRLLIHSEEAIATRSLTLTSEQSHYLKDVLRLKPGDRFIAMLPQGQRWLAVLTETALQAVLQEPLPNYPEPQRSVTLIAALPKQGFDDVVRQTTELGVGCIIPVTSQRSLLKPSDRKQIRWQRIVEEATEQCERATPPRLQPICSWSAALAETASIPHRYIAVSRQAAFPLVTCLQSLKPQVPVAIAIGPEGGWQEAEIELALEAGFQQVSLGAFVLKATTAAIAAIALIQGLALRHEEA